MSFRKLPRRPSIENLKKQAKGLHKQLQAGDESVVRRCKRCLPRLSEVAESDVQAAGVTLQEIQHVLAVEYGFHKWDELLQAAGKLKPIRTFDDLAELPDDELREIITRVGRDDLTVALKAATEPVKDRFLGNMSADEREALTNYMEWLGPMRLTDVQMMQAQILSKFDAPDDAYV